MPDEPKEPPKAASEAASQAASQEMSQPPAAAPESSAENTFHMPYSELPPGMDMAAEAPLGLYSDPFSYSSTPDPAPSILPTQSFEGQVSSALGGNAHPGAALESSRPVESAPVVTPVLKAETTALARPRTAPPVAAKPAPIQPSTRGELMRRPPPPPPPPSGGDGEDEEEGMLRMSFMDHLEELRSRILKALGGFVVAFIGTMIFSQELWRIIAAPAKQALEHLGIHPPNLVAITPMEQFTTIYVYAPLLVSVFVASPWILYQVWAFISPGLYKKERRWAVPFIATTASLFITGGCFAYFIAFRYGIEFLLGIGRDVNVSPFVSINEYFDLFVNVTLGVALIFELPVLIFFLTLLRIASPRFLLAHSRYAILGIVIIAAIVTPTPDVFNLMLFAVPMCGLFFIGVFASYLLVLKREGRSFPWKWVVLAGLGVLAIVAGVIALLIYHYHFQTVGHFPFLIPPAPVKH
jgi:sec-independent protein translocase protein TatC